MWYSRSQAETVDETIFNGKLDPRMFTQSPTSPVLLKDKSRAKLSRRKSISITSRTEEPDLLEFLDKAVSQSKGYGQKKRIEDSSSPQQTDKVYVSRRELSHAKRKKLSCPQSDTSSNSDTEVESSPNMTSSTNNVKAHLLVT